MKQEKELTREEYYAKKEREERTGKILVWIIAIVTIFNSLANLLVASNSMLDMVVIFACIVASIVLLCGYSWARVFLAILSAWNDVWGLFALLVTFPFDIFAGGTLSTVEAVVLVMLLINFLWYLFCALTLFLHKGVKDYMYNAQTR